MPHTAGYTQKLINTKWQSSQFLTFPNFEGLFQNSLDISFQVYAEPLGDLPAYKCSNKFNFPTLALAMSNFSITPWRVIQDQDEWGTMYGEWFRTRHYPGPVSDELTDAWLGWKEGRWRWKNPLPANDRRSTESLDGGGIWRLMEANSTHTHTQHDR